MMESSAMSDGLLASNNPYRRLSISAHSPARSNTHSSKIAPPQTTLEESAYHNGPDLVTQSQNEFDTLSGSITCFQSASDAATRELPPCSNSGFRSLDPTNAAKPQHLGRDEVEEFRSQNAPELPVAETAVHVAPDFNPARKAEEELLERYIFTADQSSSDGLDSQSAISKEDRSQVVIQRVPKHNTTQAAKIRHAISILHDLSNPSIAEMHEWLETDVAIWLVIDHKAGASLRQLVEQRGSFPADQIKLVLTQLLSGVLYLFTNGVAHLRICDKTLILDAKGDLIITDMSFASKYGEQKIGEISSPVSGRHGSDVYIAPEVYASKIYNARKAVIWSCGVVLYYMATGQTEELSILGHPAQLRAPTPGRKFSVASQVAQKIIPYPNRLKVPNYARDIIPKMLLFDPDKRAELIEVASRVPKMQSLHQTRPLMEIAWLDYKMHVGPDSGALSLQLGNTSSASSIFSTDTRSGLLGAFRNRAGSSAW